MATEAWISSMERARPSERVAVEVTIATPHMNEVKLVVFVQAQQASEAPELARQAIAKFAADLARAVEHPGSLG